MSKPILWISVLFFMFSCIQKPLIPSNTMQVGDVLVTGTIKHYVLGRIEEKEFTVTVKTENYNPEEIGFSVQPIEALINTKSTPGIVVSLDLKRGQETNSQSILATFVPNIEDNNVVNALSNSVITRSTEGQKLILIISTNHDFHFEANKTYIPEKELPYVIEAQMKRL